MSAIGAVGRALACAGALLLTVEAHAQSTTRDRVGDRYELRLESTSQTTGDGMSGSSRCRTTLIERVIALRDSGVELEFDLPAGASKPERDRSWEFPARVFKAPGQPFILLNAAELDARIDTWLKLGGLTREHCGRWVFTWTSNKIECDPQSVLETLEAFDMRPELRDGAPYRESGARAPAALHEIAGKPDGAVFSAAMELDADEVRKQRAEADVAVAQMMGSEPLTLAQALKTHVEERISGSLIAVWDVDTSRSVTRRTRETRVEIVDVDGLSQRIVATIGIDRRRLGPD